MFIFSMFFINMMFLNFNNPLILGLLLLIQTLNLIMIMGKTYFSFWFSYILFLVFVGGLFILFVYLISLTYNNKFMMFNLKYFFFFLSFMMILLFCFMIFKNKNIYYNNFETKNFFLIKDNMINSLKFYNFPNNLINILLIIYLLILMIIVVKITNFFSGPIRINIYI